MNDTAADRPASTDGGLGFSAEEWAQALADPAWFVATVAPGLVGTLSAIGRGNLMHPDLSALDELEHAAQTIAERARERTQ